MCHFWMFLHILFSLETSLLAISPHFSIEKNLLDQPQREQFLILDSIYKCMAKLHMDEGNKEKDNKKTKLVPGNNKNFFFKRSV